MIEEIKAVMDDMEDDKAQGSDGFSANFIKVCWEIVHKYLFKMVTKSQRCEKIGGRTNYAFLALIPKEKDANSFDRFHPISLCNSLYKILAKLIANNVNPLLGKLISALQGGFVKGRHIVDNVIQVQEAIHSSFHRKEKGMLIKLDIKNAFDQVKLPFLYDVLLSFGFCPEFVNLIKACTNQP